MSLAGRAFNHIVFSDSLFGPVFYLGSSGERVGDFGPNRDMRVTTSCLMG